MHGAKVEFQLGLPPIELGTYPCDGQLAPPELAPHVRQLPADLDLLSPSRKRVSFKDAGVIATPRQPQLPLDPVGVLCKPGMTSLQQATASMVIDAGHHIAPLTNAMSSTFRGTTSAPATSTAPAAGHKHCAGIDELGRCQVHQSRACQDCALCARAKIFQLTHGLRVLETRGCQCPSKTQLLMVD